MPIIRVPSGQAILMMSTPQTKLTREIKNLNAIDDFSVRES